MVTATIAMVMTETMDTRTAIVPTVVAIAITGVTNRSDEASC